MWVGLEAVGRIWWPKRCLSPRRLTMPRVTAVQAARRSPIEPPEMPGGSNAYYRGSAQVGANQLASLARRTGWIGYMNEQHE